MKYKVVEEYERFYVAVHPIGYKECFLKSEYTPDEQGYIIKKKEKINVDGQAIYDIYDRRKSEN